MKLINKIFLCFAVALTFTSCEDFVGGDINSDPNNPPAVPITAQMASIQINIADVYGGAFSRFNCMLTQQVEGVARQWSSFNQYTGLTPNRFDAAWTNVYEAILNEIKIAKANASAGGNTRYLGVLNVLEAYTLMTAADVWDDIPFSDALNGFDTPSPTFDSQSDVYSTVYQLLNEAENLINGPEGTINPGSEDQYFGGSLANWTATINAIRARGLLHQGDYAGAMDAAMNSYTSASDNMSYTYPDANSAGQWYRFNRDRTGDLEFHPTIRGMMTDLVDTFRLKRYDVTFNTSHPYLVPTFDQELITYREMQFIIAECALRTGTGDAHTAYLNGIRASFARSGASDANYDEYVSRDMVDPGSGGLTLEHVMTQKYIGLFLQPEVYNDFRRTGIPALTPVSGTAVPVRWDYPSNEYLFNSNLDEGSVDIFTDRVGWNR